MVKVRVLADTSFLLIPGLYGVDVVSELDRVLERPFKLAIPRPVVKELKQLAEGGKPKERAAARLGLALAKRGEVLEARGSADASILELAQEGDVVATIDASLRKQLRKRGVPVVYLRQKSHLELDGHLAV